MGEARSKIFSGEYGDIGSPNYLTAIAWLNSKESQAREKQDAEVMDISRKALQASSNANRIALAAIVISLLTAIAIAGLQVYFK